MKNKRLFTPFLILLALVFLLSGCGKNKNNGYAESTENAENNAETEVQSTAVYLSGITLSEYSENFIFEKETYSYTVEIPEGRPKIPQVSATADAGEIDIKQAAVPDGKTEGTARILLENDNATAEYFITFKKTTEKGFVLQYADVYDTKKGSGTYTSSNPDVIAVDENGVLTVKGTSDEPVSIACADGSTLTVDKTIKAQTALILVTGQSNAQGCFDNDTESKYYIDGETQQSLVEQPEKKGEAFEIDAYERTNPYGVTTEMTRTIYDLAEIKRMGFTSTLGKTWYEQSGEKVIFLNAALSGAPIESWLDPKKSQDAGFYSSYQCYNNLKQRYSILNKLLEKDGNFEITRVYNLWLQGETAMANTYYKKLENYDLASVKEENKNFVFDKSLMTDEEYYNYFLQVEEQMKEDFGVTFQCIILPRTTSSASSEQSNSLGLMTDLVPIRAAQYSLGNNNRNIAVLSRLGDISVAEKFTQYSGKEGYGYIGCKNLHYNQIGYNAQGIKVGENLVSAFFYNKDNAQSATAVELLHSDGRTKFNQNEWLKLKSGEEYRIGAIALPEYTCETLLYSSSDESIASIDQYGMIRASGFGNCEITVTSESGVSSTIKIQVLQ